MRFGAHAPGHRLIREKAIRLSGTEVFHPNAWISPSPKCLDITSGDHSVANFITIFFQEKVRVRVQVLGVGVEGAGGVSRAQTSEVT
jgi:hypothetical protein